MWDLSVVEQASVRLFAGLGRSEVDAILSAATRLKFSASQIIVRAHNPTTHLFLLRIGRVDYYVETDDGRQVLLRRLIPGNVFGVAAFLSHPTGYLGTAKAIEKSEALRWEHRVVRQLGKSYPRLAENALRITLKYLALYAQRHLRLVSNSASQRVASVLTGLGAQTGHLSRSGLEININNEDLASLADVNFFTASRLLKEWEREGVVEKRRGKVLLRTPERLLPA
jgi:CRP/FNR family transcriptional regulator, nitrogen oxide reductase regulator